jgi:hypothetical protein
VKFSVISGRGPKSAFTRVFGGPGFAGMESSNMPLPPPVMLFPSRNSDPTTTRISAFASTRIVSYRVSSRGQSAEGNDHSPGSSRGGDLDPLQRALSILAPIKDDAAGCRAGPFSEARGSPRGALLEHTFGEAALVLSATGRRAFVHPPERTSYLVRDSIWLWLRPYAKWRWRLFDVWRLCRLLLLYLVFAPDRGRRTKSILQGLRDAFRPEIAERPR